MAKMNPKKNNSFQQGQLIQGCLCCIRKDEKDE